MPILTRMGQWPKRRGSSHSWAYGRRATQKNRDSHGDILHYFRVLLAAMRPPPGRRWSMHALGCWPIRSTRKIVLKGSAEMKHVLVSLTISACLLLPSAGVVLGAGPPVKPAQNPTTGQQGSNHGFSCTTSGAGINTPGAAIAAQGSAFNPSGQAGTVYAGNPGTASATNANSTAAVAQYDVACSHQPP
jgi:hypothetical protein